MKLLFVTPEYPPDYGGGIATQYGALLPALARRGHEVHALVGCAFEAGRPGYERDGVRVSFLDRARADRWLPRFARYAATPDVQRHLAAAWAMWEQADGGAGFDVVEAVDWGLLFVPWVVERDGPPALVQLHGSAGQIAYYDPPRGQELQGELLRFIEADTLAHAAALSTSSRANAAAWAEATGRPVEIAPAPLAPPALPPPAAPTGAGFVAGRIQWWKGPDVLCEALRALGPDAPVVEWAGRDTASEETGVSTATRLARAYPDVWGERVRMLGQLEPAEVLRRQAAAAFVVVPSAWDVFNFTAPEAMAAGAVVICSDGAGAVDLVEDGANGFAFPAGDAAALAACIRRALALDAAARRAMGDAARRTVLERLDVDRVAEAREARLRALADARAAGGADAGAPRAWVQRAVRPSADAAPLGFLDQLPLRGLAGYVARRSWRRARGRV